MANFGASALFWQGDANAATLGVDNITANITALVVGDCDVNDDFDLIDYVDVASCLARPGGGPVA
jgi:hypothetical protein